MLKLCLAYIPAVFAAVFIIGVNPAIAGDAPPASAFFPFVGHWSGKGQFSFPDGSSAPLTMTMACRKAANGAAVACDLTVRSKGFILDETDLFAIDPATGQGHWIAVGSDGGYCDYAAVWSGPATLTSTCRETKAGETTETLSTSHIVDARHLALASTITHDGQESSRFEADIYKRR